MNDDTVRCCICGEPNIPSKHTGKVGMNYPEMKFYCEKHVHLMNKEMKPQEEFEMCLNSIGANYPNIKTEIFDIIREYHIKDREQYAKEVAIDFLKFADKIQIITEPYKRPKYFYDYGKMFNKYLENEKRIG